jgi:hypothetical protein
VRELRNIVIRLTTRHPGQIVDAAALEAELDLPDDSPAGAMSAGIDSGTSDAIVAAATQRLRQREPFSLDRLLDGHRTWLHRGGAEAGARQRQPGGTPARQSTGRRSTTAWQPRHARQ